MLLILFNTFILTTFSILALWIFSILIKDISIIVFDERDVIRHKLVKTIIGAYKKEAE